MRENKYVAWKFYFYSIIKMSGCISGCLTWDCTLFSVKSNTTSKINQRHDLAE